MGGESAKMGRAGLTWLRRFHAPSQAEPLPSPQNATLSGFPDSSSVHAFPLPGPQGGAPGALTCLGSQPWEVTSSQPISISWGDRARGKDGGRGWGFKGQVDGEVGRGAVMEQVSPGLWGFTPLQNPGERDAVDEGTPGNQPLPGVP